MAWFNTNWSHRFKIDVNSGNVEDTLSDFPVYLDLKQLANDHLFWTEVQSDGDDIRVTKSDGVTEVAREVNSLDTSNNTGEVYFIAKGTDALSSVSNTTFYLYFGNANATDPAEGDSKGKNAVWTTRGYDIVYHGETLSSGTHSGEIDNAAADDHEGVFESDNQGSASEDTSTTQIGQSSIKLDQGSDSADHGRVRVRNSTNDTNMIYGSDSDDDKISITGWINLNNQNTNSTLFNKFQSSDDTSGGWTTHVNTSGKLVFQLFESLNSPSNRITGSGGSVQNNTWHHVALTYDGSESESGIEVYLDGSQVTSTQDLNGSYDGFPANSLRIFLGILETDELNDDFKWGVDGHLDEMRLLGGELSSAEVTTHYNNQNDPGSFYILGSAQAQSEVTSAGGGSCGRGLSTTISNELSKIELAPALFVEVQFNSGFERYWTGVGDIEFGGKTFTGAGNLLGMSSSRETQQVRADNVTFTLSGVDSDLLSLAETSKYQNKDAKMWLGFLNDRGRLIDQPHLFYSGRNDVMEIKDRGDTAEISLTTENRLVRLNKKSNRRLTDQDQKSDYPNDDGLEYVSDMQDKQLRFGPSGGTARGGGGGGGDSGGK